jgi:hypothetical protein
MTSSKPTQEITITVPITFRVDKYDLTYTYAGETLSSTVEENIAGYVLDHLDTTGIARYIKDFLESYEGKGILTDAISANDDSVDAALPDGYKEAHEADMRAEEADGSGYAITDNIELLDKALANA